MFMSIQLGQMPTHVISVSVCLSNHNRNIIKYVIDSRAFSWRTSVRCLATTGSLNLDGAIQTKIWGSSDSQR